MRLIVDRIEGSLAVVEKDGGGTIDIPLSSLPGGTVEGTVLKFDGDKYEIDLAEEARIRARIKKKMDDLFID